ncbi:MAG: tyrosine-type recombinase/integrase [Dialister sp.]
MLGAVDSPSRCLTKQYRFQTKKWEISVSGNQDLVFCSQTGNILDPKYVPRKIKEFMNKCNLFEFTFHSFRHTHASYLLQRGVNFKVIQTRLGHSTSIQRWIIIVMLFRKWINKLP